MKNIQLERVKTEQIVKNRFHHQNIRFPYFSQVQAVRKNSFSQSLSKNNESMQEESLLIRISSCSKANTEHNKRRYLNKPDDIYNQSPKKAAIQIKSLEFPPLGNYKVGELTSSPSKTSCKNKKKTQILTRVIKDCQKLVTMMENIKDNEKDHLLPQKKCIDQINVKNIIVPPQPYRHRETFKTEEERLYQLKKQFKQVPKIEAKRFDQKQSFFIISNPIKSVK